MTEVGEKRPPKNDPWSKVPGDGKVEVEWRGEGDSLPLHMHMIRDPYVGPGDEDMFCIYCGCTEYSPCPGGCAWVVPYVCSACAHIFYGTEKITQQRLCSIPDYESLDAFVTQVSHLTGNYAVEMKGDGVHLIRVYVQEVI